MMMIHSKSKKKRCNLPDASVRQASYQCVTGKQIWDGAVRGSSEVLCWHFAVSGTVAKTPPSAAASRSKQTPQTIFRHHLNQVWLHPLRLPYHPCRHRPSPGCCPWVRARPGPATLPRAGSHHVRILLLLLPAEAERGWQARHPVPVRTSPASPAHAATATPASTSNKPRVQWNHPECEWSWCNT